MADKHKTDKAAAFDIAKSVSRRAEFSSRTPAPRRSEKTTSPKINGDEFRKAVEEMRGRAKKMHDPQEMEKLAQIVAQQSVDMLNSGFVRGSDFATKKGTMQEFFNKGGDDDDQVSEILEDVSRTARGSLCGVGGFGGDTMSVARGIASGAIDTKGRLVEGVIGDGAEVLAKEVMDIVQPERRATVKTTITISVTVPAPKVCAAVTKKVAAATEQCVGAMASGVATLRALNSAVGGLNGAVKLLTASLQKALDMKIAKMMSGIVSAIKSAHGITHPMFEAIFKMTWTENRQWKPGFGGACSEFLKCVKEIPEYFDFIQKVMGGAIADIMEGCEYLFEDVVDIGTMALQATLSGQISVSLPVPNLSVPLMSLSKQIEDVMNKIMVIKEIIRQKARMLLSRLKNLQAPELYINLPKDFFLILDVLIEAQFIYANLHIVMDKILEYFLNLLVKKFTDIANKIIDKLFSIWDKVIEIVPPLDDLLQLCWAIPNQADLCCNIALNIALPCMWGIVKPYVDMPFQCVNMVSQACDAATKLAYAIPPP